MLSLLLFLFSSFVKLKKDDSVNSLAKSDIDLCEWYPVTEKRKRKRKKNKIFNCKGILK